MKLIELTSAYDGEKIVINTDKISVFQRSNKDREKTSIWLDNQEDEDHLLVTESISKVMDLLSNFP